MRRWLFGYRDDLGLAFKRWHRGFVVLFVLVMALVTALAWALQPPAPPFQTDSLTVITSLENYTREHPGLENAINGFSQLPGLSAKRESTGELSSFFLWEHDWFCNADLPSHWEAVRQWTGSQMDPISAQEFLAGVAAHCLTLRSARRQPHAKDVLRVRYTGVALRTLAIQNTFRTTLISLGMALILLNLYYRGLIYIVCGSSITTRRSSSTKMATQESHVDAV
jgi:hypothetical protein